MKEKPTCWGGADSSKKGAMVTGVVAGSPSQPVSMATMPALASSPVAAGMLMLSTVAMVPPGTMGEVEGVAEEEGLGVTPRDTLPVALMEGEGVLEGEGRLLMLSEG